MHDKSKLAAAEKQAGAEPHPAAVANQAEKNEVDLEDSEYITYILTQVLLIPINFACA